MITPPEPDLSVCIVAQPGSGSLTACLEGLYGLAGPVDLEVIVADLAGLESGPLLSSFPEVKHYEMEKGELAVRALNRGLQLARGRYLAVWEPEVIPRQGCLESLLDFLDETPDTGLAGPAVKDGYGRSESTARRFPGPTNLYSCLTADHGGGRRREVEWLSSGVHLIRRELWEEIGPFDEGFDLPFHEADYYRRAKRAGWHNFYIGEATVVHARPGRYRAGLQGEATLVDWFKNTLRWLWKSVFSQSPKAAA